MLFKADGLTLGEAQKNNKKMKLLNSNHISVSWEKYKNERSGVYLYMRTQIQAALANLAFALISWCGGVGVAVWMRFFVNNRIMTGLYFTISSFSRCQFWSF